MSRKKSTAEAVSEEFSDVAATTNDGQKKPKGPREVRYFAVALGAEPEARPIILKEERTMNAINRWLLYCASLLTGVGQIRVLKGKWVSRP